MTTIATKTGMALDEFLRLQEEQPFELINGKCLPLLPTVAGHSDTRHRLFGLLFVLLSANPIGTVLMETTFILPDRNDSNWLEGSRTPDLMFYAADRLAAYESQQPPGWEDRPYALVPDLVVEIVSPNDSYSKVDEKVDAYLADGVRLIWVLDPQRRKATVHAPDLERPIPLKVGAALDGGDVLPRFNVPVSLIFG
jgi:Uma2 family endonuclease